MSKIQEYSKTSEQINDKNPQFPALPTNIKFPDVLYQPIIEWVQVVTFTRGIQPIFCLYNSFCIDSKEHFQTKTASGSFYCC